MKENYTARLKKILTEYAGMERKLSNPHKAAELEAEAATIK
jgi:hypothetical protein